MGTDILALQVRECAEEGGHTFVASAGKIVCELASRRPDVIETLSRADWPIQVLVSSDPLLSPIRDTPILTRAECLTSVWYSHSNASFLASVSSVSQLTDLYNLQISSPPSFCPCATPPVA